MVASQQVFFNENFYNAEKKQKTLGDIKSFSVHRFVEFMFWKGFNYQKHSTINSFQQNSSAILPRTVKETLRFI